MHGCLSFFLLTLSRQCIRTYAYMQLLPPNVSPRTHRQSKLDDRVELALWKYDSYRLFERKFQSIVVISTLLFHCPLYASSIIKLILHRSAQILEMLREIKGTSTPTP